jgi:hypothetical protein
VDNKLGRCDLGLRNAFWRLTGSNKLNKNGVKLHVSSTEICEFRIQDWNVNCTPNNKRSLNDRKMELLYVMRIEM